MRVEVHDFNIVARKKRLFIPIVHMALVMEKKAFICCFPIDACSNLATHLHEFHSDERHFVIDRPKRLTHGTYGLSVPF